MAVQLYDVRPIGEILQAILLPAFKNFLAEGEAVPGLSLSGPEGQTYIIETTSELGKSARWSKLSEIQFTGHSSFTLDFEGAGNSVRFYRARKVIEAPDLRRFSWIPPGTFTMGSPLNEQNRDTDENPLTIVTLTRGFWMGRYEVTQGEYLELFEENPSRFKLGLDYPVENTSWDMAMLYCERLTQREAEAGRLPEGFIYRLPTEAEWEYACRAGTTARYSFGNDSDFKLIDDYAWHLDNSEGRTHPVDEKLPNPWGLHGLHGSVYEWCLGWHVFYPGGRVTNYVSGLGKDHVLRGGAWSDRPKNGRAAERHWFGINLEYGNVGFRVVLAQPYPLLNQ
ncbi:formylglycine-generating enzyme family protein [Verrucomicrobia bacterium]|nr:formylglycine-generating enzyme family protein [Verrucomicrobiota bacterium]MDB4663271.1 formylglycine-generating enzyme family protein [bacterium]MDA7662032.1 formylglycine-generating enzyme family protein [Verrucomicrobiota bacterium]MDB4803304.1 formylglycine-generating enzyme family protein [Verrucomicrobiota bacterium]MDC0264362.1 formylglycine-generating enzyme family protein [Verrucomicrobiota bacterium]